MHLAQLKAELASPDFLLWINDDVNLFSDSILRLLHEYYSQPDSIVLGAMRSERGETTYSGFRMRSSRPGDLELIEPTTTSQEVDTINGNLVLVPSSAYEALGTIDPRFSHGYGDWDYGLRARAFNINLILAPEYFGICERNPREGTWLDNSLSRRTRVDLLLSRKGLPIGSQARFARKHGGALWPVYVTATYLRAFGKIVVGR
jgi:GT2 family glycosyltransferase